MPPPSRPPPGHLPGHLPGLGLGLGDLDAELLEEAAHHGALRGLERLLVHQSHEPHRPTSAHAHARHGRPAFPCLSVCRLNGEYRLGGAFGRGHGLSDGVGPPPRAGRGVRGEVKVVGRNHVAEPKGAAVHQVGHLGCVVTSAQPDQNGLADFGPFLQSHFLRHSGSSGPVSLAVGAFRLDQRSRYPDLEELTVKHVGPHLRGVRPAPLRLGRPHLNEAAGGLEPRPVVGGLGTHVKLPRWVGLALEEPSLKGCAPGRHQQARHTGARRRTPAEAPAVLGHEFRHQSLVSAAHWRPPPLPRLAALGVTDGVTDGVDGQAGLSRRASVPREEDDFRG
mmetsp:Transcript_11893/g.27881  ORF Transcript_11893/g.27881 Transcript_11893/m.27881 type:complete len:336 (-) Transcript_11893:491-1498(-)